jgi:1A family penicillin-binding protein
VRRYLQRISSLLAGRPRLLFALTGALAVGSLLTVAILAWLTVDVTAGLPGRDAIRGLGDMAQSTTIYDAKDRPVFTIFKEQRIEVPLEKISANLIKAVISVEDQRFYEHSGVDAIRVGGAVLANIEEGRRAQGGSTITQQLARQSFLTRDKSYRRKLKEVIVAAYIESLYNKREILELYLNKVYLGDGLYGFEAAARGYLAKSASDLTVDEAALLAGLIQSPSSYAPTVNRERALARRAVVLQTMVASGAIDQATADSARKAPLRIANALEIKETSGLYFKEHVRRELVERFGWQRVYQGGLRVSTTIDPELQAAAERIVEKGLQDIERRPGYKYEPRTRMVSDKTASGSEKENGAPDYLQGALVAFDPTNGYVRALVGGRDFDESRFNRAVQAKRQSGSAFKPFVFAAALEGGLSPASVITGLNDPILTAQGEWMPEDEHSDATSMTLRAALRTSSNRAAVQLLNTVGIPKAVHYAKKLNVGTPPSVPSLALGASDVTLISLTAAYGAFANGGWVRQPTFIRRVEDSDGNVLYNDGGKAEQAISENTAFQMSSMLSDVINAGTAYRARQNGFTLPAAGKTGTTNEYVDAWFVGFTPHLVTGVWLGFDQPKTIIRNGYAGELAVPIWGNFMKVATEGDKSEWLARPSTITALNVCRVSGLLPNSGCSDVQVVNRDGLVETRSMIYTEYFVKGTQPSEICPLHESPSFLDRLAGMFGKDNHGTPVSTDQAGIPSAPGTSGTTPTPPGGAAPKASPPEKAKEDTTTEEPKKKRGFWSRVFGVGKDKDSDKEKKSEERKKPGGDSPQSPR